ncbi:MAG: DMT family transporter [Marmoricola sp.]
MAVTYVLLALAIIAEVAGTVCLQLSHGFTRLLPSAVVVVGYGVSFVLMAEVLKRGLSVAVVYAIWSGIGVALVALVGVLWLDQPLTLVQLLGLVLIVGGVVALEAGHS